MGRSAIDFLDDNNRKVLEEQISKRREGKRQPYELAWTRKDKQEISTIVSPSPKFDAGAFAIVTDISERRHIEVELQESLSLLSATLDATAGGILVVDREGKIVRINKRCVEMWCIRDMTPMSSGMREVFT